MELATLHTASLAASANFDHVTAIALAEHLCASLRSLPPTASNASNVNAPLNTPGPGSGAASARPTGPFTGFNAGPVPPALLHAADTALARVVLASGDAARALALAAAVPTPAARYVAAKAACLRNKYADAERILLQPPVDGVGAPWWDAMAQTTFPSLDTAAATATAEAATALVATFPGA